MRLIVALILAWTITPLLLEWITTKGFQSPIKGTPAWAMSVVACLGVGIIVNLFVGALKWTPFNVLAWTAIIYFGANTFFNLVIKPWFPTRKA